MSGEVQNDIIWRRGEVHDEVHMGRTVTLHATAPLAALVGYSSSLRSLTSGNAAFSMHLDHYAPVTLDEQQNILNKRMGCI